MALKNKKPTSRNLFGFSQNVIALSFVSFFNDIGGETIKRAIPLFLANSLGASTAIVGLVEGVADATPQLLQPVSGFLSDRIGRRKPFVIIGQALRTAMVFLYTASGWGHVLALRFLDRSGKGIANAPRDALIAGSSEAGQVGRAFGLSRALDNGGAVVGMLLAAGIVYISGSHSEMLTRATFQYIVLLSVIPLFISLFLIAYFVRDISAGKLPQKPEKTAAGKLSTKFYLFLLFSFIFTLGSSSDAFLILKAQKAGIVLWQIFLLLAGYSVISSLSNIPFGALSDVIGRKTLLVAGWVLYAAVYAGFAVSGNSGTLVTLFLLYGLYYGLTDGAGKALVADLVDPRRRGGAYGMYNMVIGVTLLPASLIAGFLWSWLGPSAAFWFSAGTSLIGAVGLIATL